MFFLIYLPPMPAGALSPPLLLLTGARRGRTSTFLFLFFSSIQLSAEIKQTSLNLESRGSRPPDRYVQDRSQPLYPLTQKRLEI